MKIWAWVIVVGLVIGGITGTYAMGKNAGYDKRNAEVKDEIMAAQERTRLMEEKKWAKAVKAAQDSIKTEEIIVEKIRVVEKEIPKVVKEIVTLTPECADLGTEYARLRNDQVRAANSLQDTEAGLPADAEVP